jgi:hypothetical protein
MSATVLSEATLIIVLLLKRYQFNNCGNMPIIGIGRKSALRIYWPVRAQGIGGARSGHGVAGAEPPESPVFCGAKNAPK